MNEQAIRDKLVTRGRELFGAPKKVIPFTRVPEADMLLNDLAHYPHAFVLGCAMDRQCRAERAWLIPYRISQEVGGFSMAVLCRLTPSALTRMMSQPRPFPGFPGAMHRFPGRMSRVFHAAVQRINSEYGGDAARIWWGARPSAEVVYRFLGFHGVGPKLASMAANILARDFKVRFADYSSIDISVDRRVRRVFARLGLCAANATVQQGIYKARALCPEFPGLLDVPCWEIGGDWCKARAPKCDGCYMKRLCPTAKAKK